MTAFLERFSPQGGPAERVKILADAVSHRPVLVGRLDDLLPQGLEESRPDLADLSMNICSPIWPAPTVRFSMGSGSRKRIFSPNGDVIHVAHWELGFRIADRGTAETLRPDACDDHAQVHCGSSREPDSTGHFSPRTGRNRVGLDSLFRTSSTFAPESASATKCGPRQASSSAPEPHQAVRAGPVSSGWNTTFAASSAVMRSSSAMNCPPGFGSSSTSIPPSRLEPTFSTRLRSWPEGTRPGDSSSWRS